MKRHLIRLTLFTCFILSSVSSKAQLKTTAIIHSNQSVELKTVFTAQGSLVSAIMDSADGFASFKIFRSVDQGATWSQVFDGGSTTVDIEGDPILTADTSGNLYISYIDIFAPLYDNSVIRIIKSVDDGITWNTASSIQNAGLGGPKRVFEVPDIIAADDGTLHLTYLFGIADASGSVGPGRILHQYSADGGISWSSPVVVIDSVLKPFGSRINLVYNNTLVISSVNEVGTKVYYSKSLDNGVTWTTPQTLNITLSPKHNDGIQLCKVIGHLNHPVVMMIMHPTHEITHTFMTYSTDTGLTWSPITLLDTLAGYAEGVLDDNGVFHLSWLAHSGGQFHLKYVNFKDPANMPPPQILESGPISKNPNDETYIGEYQSILADPFSNIHITWIDFADNLSTKHTRLAGAVGTTEIEYAKAKVDIYPNPAENKITVHINSVDHTGAYTYNIYDSRGGMLSTGTFMLTNENIGAIDIRNLVKGNYTLEVFINGGSTYTQFTKE